MRPKTIAILIIAGLIFVVLIQNTQVVTIKILFWELSMSRIILLPLILLSGLIIGFFVGKNK